MSGPVREDSATQRSRGRDASIEGMSMRAHVRVIFLYLAATAIVSGGYLLHRMALPDAPGLALLESLLSGVIVTAVMTMLGRDPF
ncbi:hypothetical protein [Microvirga massiliensis]|uniref:hypothetical protein n=1 Tax=Microvirga massiliensis TaxID=1033741 RepID=UPI00062BCF81|nr:hypothetical protein [Microvirga massiliensis]